MFIRGQDWFSGEWLAQQLAWIAALAILVLTAVFAGLHLLRRGLDAPGRTHGAPRAIAPSSSSASVSMQSRHSAWACPVDPARTTSISCSVMQLRLLFVRS